MEHIENLSPAARNAEMQIRERQRRALPGVAEQEVARAARRENEVLAGVLEAALQTFRSRCRIAAARKSTAEAKAEETIRAVEQQLRDMRPSVGVSVGEGAKRLAAMRTYLEEIDARLPAILQEIVDVAATQTRQENFEAATRRRIEWNREAQKLGAYNVVKDVEKSGVLRFATRDGQLGVLGGNLDDRQKILVAAHRAEIELFVTQREVWRAIEEES